MASTLVQSLVEKQEYLKLLKNTLEEDAFLRAAQSRTLELLSEIRNMTCIPVSQATKFLKDLADGPLPDDNKKTLVVAINSVATTSGEASPPSGSGKRASLQRHMYMHNYLTAQDWDNLQCMHVDFNTKARVIVSRMSALGIKNPSETTMVSVTALMYLAAHTGPPATLQVNAMHAHSTLCDLKCMLKLWKGRAASLLDFPQSPQDFKKSEPEVYAAAYADGEPEPNRIDERGLQALKAVIPARRTNTAVGAVPAAARMNSKDQDLSGMLTNILRQAAAEPALPGLTIFSKRGQHTGVAPSRRPTLLALAGVGAEQPTSVAAPLAAASAGTPKEEDAPKEEEAPPKDTKVPEEPKPDDKKKQSQKTVTAMAADLLTRISKAKQSHTNLKKRPASAAMEDNPAPKKNAKETLGFPGIDAKPPQIYNNFKIYTSTHSKSWRVQKIGDRLDKAFSWKLQGPEAVWKRLTAYVRQP